MECWGSSCSIFVYSFRVINITPLHWYVIILFIYLSYFFHTTFNVILWNNGNNASLHLEHTTWKCISSSEMFIHTLNIATSIMLITIKNIHTHWAVDADMFVCKRLPFKFIGRTSTLTWPSHLQYNSCNTQHLPTAAIFRWQHESIFQMKKVFVFFSSSLHYLSKVGRVPNWKWVWLCSHWIKNVELVGGAVSNLLAIRTCLSCSCYRSHPL